MSIRLQLGIDDTDSAEGGCTTYLATSILEEIIKAGYIPADYPSLVRLNPNVPWKTRGNAAVCLSLFCDHVDVESILDLAVSQTEKSVDPHHGENDPGIVALEGQVTRTLAEFSQEAMRGIVNVKQAQKVLSETGGVATGFGNGRGVLGATAAAGERLAGDHTFELIAYRVRRNLGHPRKVSTSSVVRMDAETRPFTYNNLDPETNRILVTPHGPDPVLFGVRGETPDIVMKAAKKIATVEEIERWAIFRTNQGTDAHLGRVYRINEIRPFFSVVIEGKVVTFPRTLPGSHVIFRLGDEAGEINCAAYEPTGPFRNEVRKLVPGDLVLVYGGVRRASPNHERVLNLEKLVVLRLAEKILEVNPVCPECGAATSSTGKSQGFRCRRCGYANRHLRKVNLRLPREIGLGLHMPPPRAHRHLTKPLRRYGLEKEGATRPRDPPSSAAILGLGHPTTEGDQN